MSILRKFILILAVLFLSGINGERAQSPSNLRDALADTKYDDVDAEFADFEDLITGSGRLLQSFESTVTGRCNTWCKLKQSLGLTLVGLLLVCLAPCLVWKNEGRHVNELRRIDFCKNKAVVVDNTDNVSDENIGQLVHFVGKVSVDGDMLDLNPGPLNIIAPLANALVIKRTCMIYQKFEQASDQVEEDTFGGGDTTTTSFTIKEDWTPNGPQAERLENLQGETNSRGIWDKLVSNSGTLEFAPAPSNSSHNLPPEMAALLQQVDTTKAPHETSISKSAHVGSFGLTKEIIMAEPGVFQSEWISLPAELVAESIKSLPELRKDHYGNLTTVGKNDQPTNGDVMIKYEYAPDGFDASFIVQQVPMNSDPETGVESQKFGVDKGNVVDEKCCISEDLGLIWMVRRGRHDLSDMIKMAKDEEKMITKILRVLCWAILVAGWMMLFSIFTTVLSTLPIIGFLGKAAFFIVALIVGTVCCCGVTAIAYIRYRPLVALGILALAGGIAGIIVWQLETTKSATSPPTMAPGFIYTEDNIDVMVQSIY